MKVGNKDWKKYDTIPVDISLRNQIGRSFEPTECIKIAEAVEEMISNSLEWSVEIKRIRDGFIYNLGSSIEVGGEYILSEIIAKQKEREGESA